MRKWISFNLENPFKVFIFLALVSVLSVWGITRLEFDSSTDVLMPKGDPAYQMGERAKTAFGDNKTFMISSLKPTEGHELFSEEFFSHLALMVEEIREYEEFDRGLENERLNTILNLGGVAYKQNTSQKQAAEKDESTSMQSLEESLSAAAEEETAAGGSETGIESTSSEEDMFAGLEESLSQAAENEISGQKAETEPVKDDFWDLDKPLPEDRFRKPVREKREYNFDTYTPVSLNSLKAALDAIAVRQLNTIIKAENLEIENPDEPLEAGQYEVIVNAWEDLYLYKSLEMVKSILDPITGEDIRGTATELKPVDLIETGENGRRLMPDSPEEFEKYREKLLLNPAYEAGLYALDDEGNIEALGMSITLRAQEKYDRFMNYFWPLLRKYNRDPLEMYTMGTLVFNKYMNDFNQRDLRTYLPLTILVVILTFYLNFRSFRGLLLPTLTVLIGTLWTMGLMGLMGIKLTIIGTILPPLLIAVGSSYSIHIFNQYLIELPDIYKKDRKKGLLDAMSHISTTVFLAGFTTFVSFLTLTVNQVTALRHFGVFSALGTVFAMIVAVMLLPSALMVLKLLPLKKNSEKESGHHSNWLVQKIILFFSHFSMNHPKFIGLMVVISIGVGIVGMFSLTTETSPTTFFKPGSYIRTASTEIGKVMDGSMVLNVIFDSGRTDGAKDPQFLKYIEKVRAWLKRPEQKQYNILNNTSFGDFIKRMNMAMNSEDKSAYRIPDKYTTIQDYLEIFSGEDEDSDGRPDSFESTIDPEYRRVALLVRLGEKDGRLIGTEVSRNAEIRIREYLDSKENPQGYTYHIVGEPKNFVVLGDYIVSGQVQSIILSIFIVGIVVFLLFKNPAAGLLALIPISATIILVFGIMGYMGIPLDMAKAILSSIAIGIGVDDTIHFLNTLRKNLKNGMTLREAIPATHNDSGLAIVYTSVALVFGFSVLMLSSFTPIFHFGFLVSAVMIATTMAALLMLPTIINLFSIQIDKEKDYKIFRYINLNRFLE